MNIKFSYLAVFLIFGLIGFNAFPVFSDSWFMLIFFALLNIAVIGGHEYAAKHREKTVVSKDDVYLPQNTLEKEGTELLIARPEDDENKITSIWQGRYIRFYKSVAFGPTQISEWIRDRFGNIVNKCGAQISGMVRCEYYRGDCHCAYSMIQFDNSSITDYPVIWYRASGNRYMDFMLEGGALNGTYNNYHKNGSLRRTVRLKNGLAQGSSKTYYETGSIMFTAEFISGIKDGSYCRYYPNGAIRETGSFSGSHPAGYIKTYYDSEVIESEKYYIKNALMFVIRYDFAGRFCGQTFTSEFKTTAADDSEINSFRRLAKARDKMSKYDMYLYDPQSDNFPRIRAICSHSSGMILKEFSCEEELINFVLNNAQFKPFAGLSTAPKSRMLVKYFNSKGRLVRFR